jgi:restriction endonuclease S subunit
MLGIDALRKIKVPQMPIEEQNKVVEEYENLTEEILRKQKEIEKLSIMRKTLFR